MTDHPDHPDHDPEPPTPHSTDDRDPLTPDDTGDELASAVVDGVADASERATVEGSAELLARVGAFRRLRAELAALPPPVVDLDRDRAVATAVAAATPAPVPAEPAGEVVRLHRRPRWMTPVLAAAALIVVALIGVASLASDSDDSSDSASAPAAEQLESALATTTMRPEVELPFIASDRSADEDATSAAGAAPAPAAPTTTFPTGGGTASQEALADLACRDELAAAHPDLGPPVRAAPDGAVVVYVFETARGTVEAYEVDLTTCTLGAPAPDPG